MINIISNGQALADITSNSGVSQWLNVTTTTDLSDSANPVEASDSGQEMKRLLSDGYISKSGNTINYPLPSTVDGIITTPPRPDTFDVLSKSHLHLTLYFNENTGIISGEWLLTGGTPNNQPCSSNVLGQATQDGKADIRFLPDCLGENWIFGTNWHVGMSVSGKSTALNFPIQPVNYSMPPVFDLSGPTPSPVHRLTWFTYTQGPNLSKWMVQPNEYNVGKLRINQISGLSLSGATYSHKPVSRGLWN